MILDFNKYDAFGNVLYPGDICVKANRHEGRPLSYIIYIGPTKNQGASGNYGIFATEDGTSSIKYTSVALACASASKTRPKCKTVNELVRRYYEGIR